MFSPAEGRLAVQVVGVGPRNRLQKSSVTRSCRLNSSMQGFMGIVADRGRDHGFKRDSGASVPQRKAGVAKLA
jgi:hypothetical protein